MKCEECGTELNKDSHSNLKYCNKLCKQRHYKKTISGWITTVFHRAKFRHERDGMFFNLNKDEFAIFCKNSDKFNSMFIEWGKSGYCKEKRVSLDRIDWQKGYELNNLQFLTVSENIIKGNVLNEGDRYSKSIKHHYKKTVLKNKNKTLIFDSAKEAGAFLGKGRCYIPNAIRQRHKVEGYDVFYLDSLRGKEVQAFLLYQTWMAK